jgi:hypothetical protein
MTPEPTPRPEDLEDLRRMRAQGEKAYDDMYEAHTQRDIDTCYRDAKEWFYEAAGLARRLGLAEEYDAISDRLSHIKSVYRSQFSGS